jgi:hypothetical protein
MSSMDSATRFWSKVRKSDDDGCWMWQAARLTRTNTGALSYGIIMWRGKSTNAHRVAWELTHGPIPEGLWVLHKCDEQGCVRPSHLYLGSHADNTRDAIRRKRMTRGTERWNARLRDIDVTAIRAMGAAGFATEAIGRMFSVSGRTVRYVLRGERWAHVK